MKLAIFDFDGTIVDSLDACISCANKIAAENNYKQILLEQMDSKKIDVHTIIKNLDVPSYKLPFVLTKMKSLLEERMSELQCFEGLPSTLKQLHKNGWILAIVSSNSTKNIKKFLEKNKLPFDDIVGDQNLFGKASKIKSLLKKYKPSQAFYIGDEVRDIQAAQQASIPCIAVSWGFGEKKLLKQNNPYAIIDKPKQLLNYVK